MSKIKVLHIITRLDKGGSSTVTLLTAARLNKERFDVTLMSGPTVDYDGEVAGFISRHNINFVLMPHLVREISLIKDIRAFWEIYHFIKKGKFDIIHTHTSKAGILGRWAAKLAKVAIIVHKPHGHIFYGYFGPFMTKIFIYIEKLTALITDKIITLTEKGIEEHVKFGIAGSDKFISVYSGIEIDKFSNFKPDISSQKKILQIPSDVFVIGTVSRLDPVKGNKYFIASLPGITQIFPQLRAVFVGEGTEKEELRLYAEKLGVLKNVIFLGTYQDVRPLICIFDIFILTSLNEGMGRVLLEAQALGVPVIATNVGGIPEVVRDRVTGILVPAANPQVLTEAIVSLLKDKAKRDSMSQEAKKWVNSQFSAETMVSKISGLYESLLCR